MTLDELRQVLALTPNHSILLDIRLSSEFPGYVRSVELCEDLRICVSFEVYGLDEGGAYYWGTYFSLESAVRDLEVYLETSLVEWSGESADSYPPQPQSLNEELKIGHASLKDAISERRVALPKQGAFELRSSYWLQYQKP